MAAGKIRTIDGDSNTGGRMDIKANKDLGQNFLFDDAVLHQIADYAALTPADHVLEIGPGLGTLTTKLCDKAGQVTAVEFDQRLADSLLDNIAKWRLEFDDLKVPPKNVTVVNQDILRFDLASLPYDYKVVANIPYNLTAKIIKKLLTADNAPQTIVLLVQKEVAERLAAHPGKLSVIAISAQLFAEVELGIVVPAELFIPAPKVDSQVVIMHRRAQPLVPKARQAEFFALVNAGFCEKRKKLKSSLAVGLHTTKERAEQLLTAAQIDPNRRAQELSIDEWCRLADL